ncbi:hypothetical protein ABL78_0012 [Leptomonas seymouri]|uniref:Uncharacterized protein n=1 Tax=Leptomonas seymouri TaxID=5684 RepID=A0A0N0P974_LEPSE|nr:hypothetical protein ABL78_0012 [Leptomonas seymouri]|eukprot:KPI90779.1 hypothetical protein ABL78_0012 [Leptomonas seymouri]
MSSSRRAQRRNAQPKGETYSRADEALWDDEYLLKLFNEQLGNSGAVSEVARESDNDDSSEASTADTGPGDGAHSASSDSHSTASSKYAVDQKIGGTQSAAVATANGLKDLRLPDSILVLVQSFYNAGFEAGRYVGHTEAAGKKSRKRHR